MHDNKYYVLYGLDICTLSLFVAGNLDLKLLEIL